MIIVLLSYAVVRRASRSASDLFYDQNLNDTCKQGVLMRAVIEVSVKWTGA